MKIICTLEERNNLMEVITAGCCWIGNGEGKKFLALKIETDYKKQKEIYESDNRSIDAGRNLNMSPADAPIGTD